MSRQFYCTIALPDYTIIDEDYEPEALQFPEFAVISEAAYEPSPRY